MSEDGDKSFLHWLTNSGRANYKTIGKRMLVFAYLNDPAMFQDVKSPKDLAAMQGLTKATIDNYAADLRREFGAKMAPYRNLRVREDAASL